MSFSRILKVQLINFERNPVQGPFVDNCQNFEASAETIRTSETALSWLRLRIFQVLDSRLTTWQSWQDFHSSVDDG